MLLISPNKENTIITYILEFEFMTNVVKYETLVEGLRKEILLDVKYLKVFNDSKIIIKQVRNVIHYVSNHLKNYQSLVQDSTSHFFSFNIIPIPRLQNASLDVISNLSSTLIPPKDFNHDCFSI